MRHVLAVAAAWRTAVAETAAPEIGSGRRAAVSAADRADADRRFPRGSYTSEGALPSMAAPRFESSNTQCYACPAGGDSLAPCALCNVTVCTAGADGACSAAVDASCNDPADNREWLFHDCSVRVDHWAAAAVRFTKPMPVAGP